MKRFWILLVPVILFAQGISQYRKDDSVAVRYKIRPISNEVKCNLGDTLHRFNSAYIDTLTVDSLRARSASIETLFGGSPIIVKSKVFFMGGANIVFGDDTSSSVSWFGSFHTDTTVTFWGDTAAADTSDTVAMNDTVWVWAAGPLYKIKTNSGGWSIDSINITNFDNINAYPCGEPGHFSDYTQVCNSGTANITASDGDTMFVYRTDDATCTYNDSLVIIGIADGPATYWIPLCESSASYWSNISDPPIKITDTLYQTFNGDTFFIGEHKNY